MLRKLQLSLVLLAWLLATGSQWDLVQTFAWGRMIATKAQTMPLAEAMQRTFTPGYECPICKAVAAAKKQEAQSHDATTPDAKAPGKILLVFQPTPTVIITAPDVSPWPSDDQTSAGTRRAAPPTPPPRAA